MMVFSFLSLLQTWIPRNMVVPACIAAATVFTPFIITILPTRFLGRVFNVIFTYPAVEELIFRILLVGVVMTLLFPCPPDKTALAVGIAFGLAHIGVVLNTGDMFRLVDGFVVGFLNAIACLVYLRLFFPVPSVPGYIVAYLALVTLHSGYNAATVFFASGMVRIVGVLLAIGAWIAWMPILMR